MNFHFVKLAKARQALLANIKDKKNIFNHNIKIIFFIFYISKQSLPRFSEFHKVKVH